MPINFLTDLPLELRDKIYVYALGSPAEINPVPLFCQVNRTRDRLRKSLRYSPSRTTATNENGTTIYLSLLLTCKQIRSECKDLIWFHNGLQVTRRQKTELSWKLEHYLEFETFHRIRHLIIRLELLDWDELEWLYQSLQSFTGFAKNGKLQSVQLLAKTDRSTHLQDFLYIGNLRKDGLRIDGRWYRASHLAGQRARCERKFVINTGWPRVSNEPKQRWIRELLVNDQGATEVLLEGFNNMFGGELYVDGCLCFKDRRKIKEAITWDPRDGSIEIRPERRFDGANTTET